MMEGKLIFRYLGEAMCYNKQSTRFTASQGFHSHLHHLQALIFQVTHLFYKVNVTGTEMLLRISDIIPTKQLECWQCPVIGSYYSFITGLLSLSTCCCALDTQ